MQHDGWLETYLHSRFPKHNLVFRNLGFSGDELTLRLRSANFGSPDTWLKHTKADVVFAFFGYNESFRGKAGLDKFKNDLDDFIKKTLRAEIQRQERSAAGAVLADRPREPEGSQPARRQGEQRTARTLHRPRWPRSPRPTRCRSSICFSRRSDLYAKAASPLTINGIHLNEARQPGCWPRSSTRPCSASRPDATPQADLEKLRQAVLDKNFYWFNRYRTVDGYSIYGGRADLTFVDGQTNRDVMDREMEILDVMTANRDNASGPSAQGKRSQGR